MSLSNSKHVINQKIINFGPVEPKDRTKEGDPLYIQKKVDGWVVVSSVTENGKVTMIGEKSTGRFGTIKVIVETTENTAPLLKLMPYPYDLYTHEGKYVEVNDRKERTAEEFKKENKDEYERQYLGSSIVTPNEFFNQAVPSFELLLKEKTLDQYIPKIADEVSKVQKPFNRNYVKLEK